ncbi:MAG: MarR family winged helix-turn-helix transcriptional regulator [Bacteroidales bacterium]
MYIIHHKGCMQLEISEHFHLDKGSTSSLIKTLEKNGLIKKEQHGEDRMFYKLYTTQKTERLLPEFHQIFQGWMKILLKDFTQDKEEEALRLLNCMIENTHHYLKGEGEG